MSILSGAIGIKSPIELLNLSSRSYNALLRSGIETVEQLVQKKSILRFIPGLGTKCISEIESSIERLLPVNLKMPEESITHYVSTDIDQRQLSELPDFSSFLEFMKELVNEYLSNKRIKNEKFEEIIIHRLYRTNDEGKACTLQEIGDKFGITRESVRQLTQKFEDWARYFILQNSHFGIKLKIFKNLADVRPMVGFEHMHKSVRSVFPKFQDKELILFLRFLEGLEIVFDITEAIFADRPTYSFTLSPLDASSLYRRVRDLVEENPSSLQMVRRAIGSSCPMGALDDLLSLNDQFVVVGNRIFKKQSDARPLSVTDILLIVFEKEQRPLHFREATSIIREVLGFRVKEHNVHQALLEKTDRFVRTGMGAFELVTEKTLTGKTEELIEKYLEKCKEPIRFREICEFVKAHRNLTDGAIRLAISRSTRIIQIRLGRYALREWGGKAIKAKSKKYIIRLSKGIHEVLSSANQPLSVNEIAERLYTIHGGACSTNIRSIRLELEIGKHANEIHRTLDELYIFTHKLP